MKDNPTAELREVSTETLIQEARKYEEMGFMSDHARQLFGALADRLEILIWDLNMVARQAEGYEVTAQRLKEREAKLHATEERLRLAERVIKRVAEGDILNFSTMQWEARAYRDKYPKEGE